METVEIREYLRPLLKWWWLVALATLIAAASSFIYTKLQPDVYQSYTTVMVGTTTRDPNPNTGEIWLAQALAQNYADIAKRTPMQEATMKALGTTWLPYYNVSVIPNTQVIQIDVFDSNPEWSQRVAQELAHQLILQGPAGREQQERQAFVEDQLTKLKVSITSTESEIVSKEADMAKEIEAYKIAALQEQIAALQNKLNTMRDQYAKFFGTTQQGASNTLSVLEPAVLPTQPVGSSLLVNLLVAAVVGFSLAAAGAYLIEYLDDSIRTTDNIKRVFGITVLGAVPELDTQSGQQDKLVMLQNVPSAGAEAYRSLRTNLQFTALDRPLRVLLVTSPSPSEGKSLTAANLGAALARAGQRVILVDVDLHRPTQHKLFKTFNNVGITTALLEENEALESFLQPTTVPGLQLLTSGPLPPNPAELVGSKRMQSLLARLQTHADVIILDSPPISAVVDPIILSTEADGVLLVVRLGKTRRDAARRALHALQQVNARILGMALNGAPTDKGDYLYNYKYNNYYKHEQPIELAKMAMPKTAHNQEELILSLEKDTTEDVFQTEFASPLLKGNGNSATNGNANGQVIISGRNILYKSKNG